MSRVLVVLVFAWLVAPAAGHAQSPAAAALVDLAGTDADKREAAVTTLGQTGDPKWLAFLAALREGSVYARKPGGRLEIVVGGTKSTRGDQNVIEIFAAYDRAPLGTVPLADLTEVGADRALRLVIKPFLDADETRVQLRNPDPAVRQGAAVKLGNQADAGAVPVVEEALRKEPRSEEHTCELQSHHDLVCRLLLEKKKKTYKKKKKKKKKKRTKKKNKKQ